MPRAVILTCHLDDYHAIRGHVTEPEEKTHPQGTVYELGKFSANGQLWDIAIAQIAASNSDAAIETERAIAYWEPNIVLSVGTAAGLRDVDAGDVVAGIEAYSYESGKTTASGFLPRPKIGLASYRLEQRAKAEARGEDWLDRIQGKKEHLTPKAVVGAIAAGEKEISSTQSEVYQLLQSNYGDALAVDTIGYGILKAVHANAGTCALIIRGITHVIDQEILIDPIQSRIAAAQHASAFAFEILANLEAASSFGLSPVQYDRLKRSIADASKGLLDWKRTLINHQHLDRPELGVLLNRIETQESSTTIVLGLPGSGKSALMATLGDELIKQGYAVLAIKADQLNGAIETIEDLQRDLHLELHPSDAIYAVASQEPIIVLIDQLDAISELLDRKSHRLNLLLSLIQRLSKSQNVHIVATCREFDFRYGSQFSRLAEIEQLPLNLPDWESVAPILEAVGHQPASMGEPFQELLQNPFHLNIFLDIAQPGDEFTSSQQLLDRLWTERITKQPDSEKCISFLNMLAERMTEEEILWLPDAIADHSPEILQRLEHAGLLMSNPVNSTISFRHQTYYDHTLARAFASGSQSLTQLVLARQDGLFVRPVLLRILNYLRGKSPGKYQEQLVALLQTLQHQIRSHIRTLLIEFVGAQRNPEPIEVELLIPLLESETEGVKVLDAMIGSPGWFKYLRDRAEFTQWLEKPVEQAVYCAPLIAAAATFAPEEVWDLLDEYWLANEGYDFLSIRVIWNLGAWTLRTVRLTQQVIQRSGIGWHDVAALSERIAEALPDHATSVIRSHLDYRLNQAVQASELPPPPLSPDADEASRSVHAYQNDCLNPLKALLESESNLYEIEVFAEAYPKNFLDNIWSWFTDLIQRIAYDENPVTIGYRWDRVGDYKFSSSEIIRSLLTSITQLAQQDKAAFLEFADQNSDSDLLAVHRLLARGLEVVASSAANYVLSYLLADSRRLRLGSQMGSDRHKETEKLIKAIFPYLQPEDRGRLEQEILHSIYWQPGDDKDVEFRRRCLQYNREHRLSLLQAIPEQYLSSEVRRLKEQEERAFPWINLRKNSSMIIAQNVGPRMTKDEMSRAQDQHLLNLFDELSDQTEWDAPRQRSNDFSRSGGAIQQSREFGELVKEEPSRFIRILPQLEPKRHESYLGAALENLATTDFPAEELICIIEESDRRGFASENFRADAATALEKIAERQGGLPLPSLSLLENWLPDHSQPELDYYRSKEEKTSDARSSILFDLHGSHVLPGGRGNIVRAIAEGYLKQNPPDRKGWAKFIRSQLGVEPHPAVWADILVQMPTLLNDDRKEATVLFDQVIQNCPEVLQYAWTLYFISHALGWFEPKETIQGWLDILLSDRSNFSQQAYGELLVLQHLHFQDEWSDAKIQHHLAHPENEAILCGLAHAASHLWMQRNCRKIAAKILCTLADSSAPAIQQAVARVFRVNRENFKLDSRMSQLIQRICTNQAILLEAANDLTDIVEAEELVQSNPKIAAEICSSLVAIGGELTNPARPTAFIAESLTTIAIQLHRHRLYRETGLQIFEQLLTLNLRETKSALETLDRKPNRASFYSAPRRRLRSRQSCRS